MAAWFDYGFTCPIILGRCIGSREFWRIIALILLRLRTIGPTTASIWAILPSISRWRRGDLTTLRSFSLLWSPPATRTKEFCRRGGSGESCRGGPRRLKAAVQFTVPTARLEAAPFQIRIKRSHGLSNPKREARVFQIKIKRRLSATLLGFRGADRRLGWAAVKQEQDQNTAARCRAGRNPFWVERIAGGCGPRRCSAHYGFFTGTLLALMNDCAAGGVGFFRQLREAALTVDLDIVLACCDQNFTGYIRHLILGPLGGNRHHREAIDVYLHCFGSP